VRIDEKMTYRPRLPGLYVRRGEATQRRRVHRGMAMVAIAFTTVGFAVAPPAAADSTDSLRAAVAAARGTACGPLRSDPVVDQAAEGINETTNKWIDHAARAVPEADALPVLKDLGYGGSKAAILSSAANDDGDAIKGLILQGFAKIPDCSYTDVGVSTMYNTTKDMILMTVVLAA
jgi:hypothetical protein